MSRLSEGHAAAEIDRKHLMELTRRRSSDLTPLLKSSF